MRGLRGGRMCWENVDVDGARGRRIYPYARKRRHGTTDRLGQTALEILDDRTRFASPLRTFGNHAGHKHRPESEIFFIPISRALCLDACMHTLCIHTVN